MLYGQTPIQSVVFQFQACRKLFVGSFATFADNTAMLVINEEGIQIGIKP